ncbi:transient receptor potential cation channel subfamily V member 6-like [Actinia tenebrosa]|uniref:Transient receptor potential cation channel subfamily V member 6-like n=1 Tax=Actinia tenebrosa TaxID=6105 RepID=A0A6P8HR27_ACTTE|nr:transient receptor potential cation channel subfamily V member 6-like [Actinia tenebrosa]XP_031558824.1 transient receptor potential cation channel subfamily V member 6-like [Actinia tenebrosa]
MAARDASYSALEMTERGEGKRESPVKESTDHTDDIGNNFDEEFWIKVRNTYNETDISWNHAMDVVQVEHLIEKYENSGAKLSEAPLLVMLKRWPNMKKYRENPSLKAALEHHINRLAEIILGQETGVDYKYFRDKDDPTHKTLVHLTAELNYVSVCRTLLDHFPGLLYITSKAHSVHRRYLPVELALINENDAVSAFLISRMKHERVQQLFLCEDQEHPGNFSFKRLIESPVMKKTVVAILNCMVTPHWPYLPERKDAYSSREEEENIEHAWNSVPEEPMSYQFYYQILDGDEWGRLPKIPDPNGRSGEMINNDHFNWKNKSCLYSLAFSKNEEAIQHPVVRLLVKKKWTEYAHTWFCAAGGFYVTFLLLLSYALIHGCTRSDPTQYDGGGDWLRQACEICVIVMVIVYIAEEINQLEKEKLQYFKNIYNLFDWFGLLSIILVIPLRFAHMDEQWVLAAFGYFFNFLRLFKYACVSRTTGLYTKTLAKIIYRDITRFGVVFIVVFFAFCGTFFMSLRASGTSKLFGDFHMVMLAGVRALVEQQPPAEDYSKFKWLPVLVILGYMATVVVILLNILIAQLSFTYAEAKKSARIQYDKERMVIITRLEHSRLHQVNLRIMHFKDKEWIDELQLANELLEYSEDRHPLESIEDKLDAIRTMMKKIIRKMPLTVIKG